VYKKITYILLILITIFILTISVSAYSTTLITAGVTRGTPGEIIEIPIRLDNNDGLISLSLIVEYDMSVFSMIEFEDTQLIPGGYHTTKYSSPYVLTWVNDDLAENITESGVIANLYFQVSDAATEGEYTIKLRSPRHGIIMKDGENETFSMQHGTVVIDTGDDNSYNVTGTVTSSDSDTTSTADDTITIRLANAENKYTVTVDSSGVNKTVDYSIEDVAEGTYTMTVSKPSHVEREYTVVVGSDDVTRDVQLYLYGDITVDGYVNKSDSDLLRQYFAGYAVVFDETLADVDNNCKLTRRDAMILVRHLAGWEGYTLPYSKE